MRELCRRAIVLAVVLGGTVLGAASCTGDAESADQITAESATSAPEPTAEPTEAPSPTPQPTVAEPAPTSEPEDPANAVAVAAAASVFDIVSTLASDELMGRDNQTEGSELAQDFLVSQLELLSEPAPASDGQADYRFGFDTGTNLIGMIPGTDLADEYLIVGAHYDHVGTNCRGISSEDNICNGAADNAAGVAAAIEVARTFADEQPRRSIIVALWDSEEDGLLGAREYVSNPVVPLAQTVAYINFDIQGANLSPALSEVTIAVGAETGGTVLLDAVDAAAAGGPLDTLSLSLVFGQGRSDHAPFAVAAVPIVFFTDATNGCYHTVEDDLDALDFAKLESQIATATRLAADLANTDSPPQFDPDAAFTSFDDAVRLRLLAATFEPDFGRLGPQGETETRELLAELDLIVEAGEDQATGASMATVLGGLAQFIERLANAPCLPVPS